MSLLILLITRFIYLFSKSDTDKNFLLVPLFRFSYGFMFLALLMSIGPFVIRYGDNNFHQYQRPIGLVLGCSIDKDAAKDLQCFPLDKNDGLELHSDNKNLLNSAVDELLERLKEVKKKATEFNDKKTADPIDQQELNIARSALLKAEQEFNKEYSRVKSSSIDELLTNLENVLQKREELNTKKIKPIDKEKLNAAGYALLKAQRELYRENNKVKDLSKANLQWLLNIGGSTVCHKHGLSTCEITGGIVVPLYFIVLALLGGAISLTRRVPEYQKRSETSYKSFATLKEPFMTKGQVRETLAFQIIQFISAPLIAIVAYQLIDPSNRAGAVALGFIAGFSSEAILMMIRQLTNKITPEKTESPSLTGSVAGQVTESGAAGLGIKDALVTLVGHASQIKTDENGHFLIKNTPAGDMVVEVIYKDNSKLLKVIIEQGITTQCPMITFP